MTRNEMMVELTKTILEDWRKVLLSNDDTKGRVNLLGDTVDISFRAMQKAKELTREFYDES